MIELTEQQRQEVRKNGPIRLIDPETHQQYVLVRQEVYDQLAGLLVSVALLSLGAAFWYNTLKGLASLRPQLAIRQDRERKSEKPA